MKKNKGNGILDGYEALFVRRCFQKCIGSHWHTLLLACVPQIDTMHPTCVNGCISNLHIKSMVLLLRLAGAFFYGKRKAHLSRCGSDVLQIASISSRRICFCLSVRVLHFEKSFCCSSVNCASSPSAKN